MSLLNDVLLCFCSETVTLARGGFMVLTLPGFRRSLLPFTLYSMWTRRSKFSWGSRESREMEGDYLVMDGRGAGEWNCPCLFVNEREGGGKGCDTENWIGGAEIEGACVSTVCQPVCVCQCMCVEEKKKACVINRGGEPKWGTGGSWQWEARKTVGGGFENYLHELLMFEGERKSSPPLHCSLCNDTPGTFWWHHLSSPLVLINKLRRPAPKRDRPLLHSSMLFTRGIHTQENLSCLTSSRLISIRKWLFHCQTENKDVSQ